MAIGFVQGGGGFGFQWLGNQVKQKVDTYIDKKMWDTGIAVVAKAQALAPVKTGALRASIGFVVAYNEMGGRHTLSIQVGMPYGIFQELGTRNIPPHPFIRPALNEMSRIWGFDVEMQFAGMGYNAASGTGFHGLIHTKGGFAGSASHRFKPLSHKQIRHVEHVLKPSAKRHWRGNVKRARLTVG